MRQDERTTPNYTILEASHYLHVSQSTLKSWVLERDYRVHAGQRRSSRLIEPAQSRPTLLLSFLNLVEAHVLHAIRHQHGVKLRKVRSALPWVERKLDLEHPLATQEFKTDGIDLFIEQLGDLVVASQNGQIALREAFENHLQRIEHDAGGLAERLFPFTRPSHADQPRLIVIDPRISFGRPIIGTMGIPTAAIIERHNAGESVNHLAHDYRCSSDEIEEAIRCETSRAA